MGRVPEGAVGALMKTQFGPLRKIFRAINKVQALCIELEIKIFL
jgi:hypothetical protein